MRKSLALLTVLVLLAGSWFSAHSFGVKAQPNTKQQKSTQIDGKVLRIGLDRDSAEQIVLVDARLENIGGSQFVTGRLVKTTLFYPVSGKRELRLTLLEGFRAALKWDSVRYFGVFDTLDDCKKSFDQIP